MGRLKSSSNSSSSGTESSVKSCNRGHWRPAEDERLMQLVKQYGPQNWNFISEHLQGRSGKSCRLRWYNQLDPNINKKPYTDEEEEMLLALHKVKGNKWAAIARFFPGRTDNAVKNHFHVIMARRKREQLTLFGETTIIGHNNSRINNPILQHQNYRNNGIIFGSSTSSSHTSTTPLTLTSAVLGSYQSFTTPGIPTIGKVVPLSLSVSNHSHAPFMNTYEEQEPRAAEDVKQKGVPFIDFLGMGSSSAHHNTLLGDLS